MPKTPVYLSISNDLRKKIYNRELSSGEKLPNQRELAKTYQTTVMTIRQALQILISESLVESVHGVGTFVTKNDVFSRNYKLLGFSQEMNLRSIEISTKVISKDYQVINKTAAEILDLQASSGLAVLERLRYFKKFPIIYQKSYIASGFKSIIQDYQEADSLYETINKHTGQTIMTWKEIFKPILLNAEQANNLGIDEGECVIEALRCTYTSNLVPILYDEAILSNRHIVVTTEKSGNFSHMSYQIYDGALTDPFTYLRSFVE